MQLLKKLAIFCGIGICMIGVMPVYTEAEQLTDYLDYLDEADLYQGRKIEDGGDCTTLQRRGVTYVAKYDPRTRNAVSKVEAQGSTDTCWAFATIAAIESNVILKGYADSSINLSENHLAYFFYNRQTDPLGYTGQDRNQTRLFGHWAKNGGTLQGTALYLTTWGGVVKETTSEDNAEGEFSPRDLTGVNSYQTDYRIVNTYFYEYDVNTIKQAIMDHGAVATGMYISSDYISRDEKSYYCPKEAGNHAVTLVGWDDNYSRDNFTGKSKPSGNGAWIVKNSYGTGRHENGYFYISYQDASLSDMVAFEVEPTELSYDNNYQYDGTANPMYAMTLPSGTTYANVFKVKGDAEGDNEVLKAVSANVYTSNVSYELQIYTGVTSASNPTKGKAMLSKPQTGTMSHAGYNRIVLKNPITLTAGEKYAVVIKFTTKSGESANLGVDKPGAGYNDSGVQWISFNSYTEKGRGFVYYGKKWMDVGVELSADIRIKAYTDNTSEKTTYKLDKNMGVSKGTSSKISLTINPSSVKRNVTWTSSNKKVATISSSGKIKGVAYGTVTIRGKFVAGSKTKTLSCKVTVGPSELKNYKVKAKKNKLTVTWKKNSEADGYEIYYSSDKNSGYKKLTTVKKGSTTKYSKKINAGTYYVKMRPYKNQGGKKLCGSYTAAKKVTIP